MAGQAQQSAAVLHTQVGVTFGVWCHSYYCELVIVVWKFLGKHSMVSLPGHGRPGATMSCGSSHSGGCELQGMVQSSQYEVIIVV
jgi:hypothetical protein